MRALVTGAGGFVGRHLVARLTADGWDVVGLTRADVDLADPAAGAAAVRAAEPDAVFSLAAARRKASPEERAATVAVNTSPWLVDGTADAVRAAVPGRFGVAGLTLPGGGAPVPSSLLAAELVRLGADFTFLRRAFTADMAGRDPEVEVPRLLASLQALRRAPAGVAAGRRAALVDVVSTTRAGAPERVPVAATA